MAEGVTQILPSTARHRRKARGHNRRLSGSNQTCPHCFTRSKRSRGADWMIFDPALAAAARRHVRAQAKSNKAAISASSSATTATGGENGSSTTSASTVNADAPEAPSPPTSGNTTGTFTAAAPLEESNIEHGSADERDTASVAPLQGGEIRNDDNSYNTVINSVAAVAAASAAAAAAGARSRNSSFSAGTAGTDLEGAMRVGPVVSRPKTMKRRVLLKIVVLGCSNVSLSTLHEIVYIRLTLK